eukprot:CAMPEP_0198126600 /NCGR_PEP_ID=MMETSP1442-20131203/45221_1 /TAXON_ID= /ORGANISM="Craspedostauros australis, Strain CCMP3328" /LENGTH=54 /DNA_ID=CAMNT_0043786409 /DNA_START=687 /DNA_END=847 /DNA_ORIENTATION=+
MRRAEAASCSIGERTHARQWVGIDVLVLVVVVAAAAGRRLGSGGDGNEDLAAIA